MDYRSMIADLGKKQEPKTKSLEVSNISQQGMLLLFPHDIHNEEFLCRIHFPGDKLPSEFICRVAHKNKAEDDVYRLGVYFVDVPTDIQKKITDYSDES